MSELKFFLSAVVVTALVGYGFGAAVVGWVNAGEMSDWCEFKDGNPYDEKPQRTNKRWSPHAYSLGMTGDCINPADKGL